MELRVGDGAFFGGFIADVVKMAIPPAAGIGDIIDLIKVDKSKQICLFFRIQNSD